MQENPTVGGYLIERLRSYGVEHVFGVAGDYVLGFFSRLRQNGLSIVNTVDEQGAGFAADAYARLRGLGVVCITYCVGGLKVANCIAQAFAEKSPVVVISGAPGIRERVKNPLLHHKVKDFDTQLRVFTELTAAATVIDDAETARREIDRVLGAAMRYKRPVYIELPRDVIDAPLSGPPGRPQQVEAADPEVLSEALREATEMINAARRPVLLAGVELHRFGLQNELVELVEKVRLPVAATILAKSVIAERHPLYIGVYEGAMGRKEVRELVESSDCLVMLGALMSDINLGIYTADLDPKRSISVTSERASIRHHVFENLPLADFLRGLIAAPLCPRSKASLPHPVPPPPFQPEPDTRLSVARLFQCLNSTIDERTIVIADPGDALFGSADLFIHGGTEFLAPAYYASLGFAVPAALGAQLANPSRRPLVLVGDGAFQMTGAELSTCARFGLNPIVVVLNNRGYGTERPMLDGPFNDVAAWQYRKLPEVWRAGVGYGVRSEEELAAALASAHGHNVPALIEVEIDPNDTSPALQRLTASLAERVR